MHMWLIYVSSSGYDQEVATKYDVKAMPTFLLMKAGAQVDKLVGANPDEIKKRIEGLVQSYQVYLAQLVTYLILSYNMYIIVCKMTL